MKKTLVVINGVTGAVGSACLAQFSRHSNIDIYGLSRQAMPFSSFKSSGKLPTDTLICSIGDISNLGSCRSFAKSINKTKWQEILYVHAVGIYPFELDTRGNIKVSHDKDGDGIDDRVLNLSYKAFFKMVTALNETGLKVKALIFGGIADKYKTSVHKSWWKVMEKVKKEMKNRIRNNTNATFCLLNISSVICPNEILTRPFVFQKTNAHPRFWLMPYEVAKAVEHLLFCSKKKLCIKNLFHKSNYYEKDYFINGKFTERKRKELGIRATGLPKRSGDTA